MYDIIVFEYHARYEYIFMMPKKHMPTKKYIVDSWENLFDKLHFIIHRADYCYIWIWFSGTTYFSNSDALTFTISSYVILKIRWND